MRRVFSSDRTILGGLWQSAFVNGIRGVEISKEPPNVFYTLFVTLLTGSCCLGRWY